jgi:hypothetical protein
VATLRRATCTGCGQPFEFVHRHGRPRQRCFTCSPEAELAVKREARRESYHRRRAASGAANYATTLCGCQRDYLTVPLEDAHRCPYPEPLRREPEPDPLARGRGVYSPERYPWRNHA